VFPLSKVESDAGRIFPVIILVYMMNLRQGGSIDSIDEIHPNRRVCFYGTGNRTSTSTSTSREALPVSPFELHHCILS